MPTIEDLQAQLATARQEQQRLTERDAEYSAVLAVIEAETGVSVGCSGAGAWSVECPIDLGEFATPVEALAAGLREAARHGGRLPLYAPVPSVGNWPAVLRRALPRTDGAPARRPAKLVSPNTWMVVRDVPTTDAQQAACVAVAIADLQADWDAEYEGYALQDLRGYASRSYEDIHGVIVIDVALERWNEPQGVLETTWSRVDVDTLAVDEVYRRTFVPQRGLGIS